MATKVEEVLPPMALFHFQANRRHLLKSVDSKYFQVNTSPETILLYNLPLTTYIALVLGSNPSLRTILTR